MKKNVYITGAGGYLGKALVDKFLTDREYNIYLSFDNVKKLKVDYNIQNADIVIHLVAKHPSYLGEDMEEINYGSTKFLIDNIKDDCHFIFLSSELVFKGGLNKENTVNNKRDPQTKYGQTKMKSEDYIKSLSKKYSIIRTSMLFGGDDSKRKNFINFLHEETTKGNKLELYTDVFCRPTHIQDLTKFIYHVIIEELKGVFHASGNLYLNRYEIANIIFKYSRKKALFVACQKPDDSWLQSYNLIPCREFQNFNKRNLGD